MLVLVELIKALEGAVGAAEAFKLDEATVEDGLVLASKSYHAEQQQHI
jgi:hypothetical protein